MEGQVGMMHEADDVLHGGASLTTLRWLDTDMGVALAEPLIEVGRRSNLPTEGIPRPPFALVQGIYQKVYLTSLSIF